MSYYVTVQDGGRTGFLAGPFRRHGDALRTRHLASCEASRVDGRAAWYAFGTSRVKAGPLPVGRLNQALGLPTDGRPFDLLDPPASRVDRRVCHRGRNLARPGLLVSCSCEPPCADDGLDVFHPVVR